MSGLTKLDASIESYLGPLSPIYTNLVALAARNDENFREERSQQMLEWLSEHQHALRMVFEKLAELKEPVEHVEKLTADSQFKGIYWNYKLEAAREATNERRAMLAYAAAESVDPSMTIAQLARVERTLRELDPGDLLVLAELNDSAYPSIPPTPPGVDPREFSQTWIAEHQELATQRLLCWRDKQPSGHILAASGCLYVQEYSWNFAPAPAFPLHSEVITVTDLGKWVLRITELYRQTRLILNTL